MIQRSKGWYICIVWSGFKIRVCIFYGYRKRLTVFASLSIWVCLNPGQLLKFYFNGRGIAAIHFLPINVFICPYFKIIGGFLFQLLIFIRCLAAAFYSGGFPVAGFLLFRAGDFIPIRIAYFFPRYFNAGRGSLFRFHAFWGGWLDRDGTLGRGFAPIRGFYVYDGFPCPSACYNAVTVHGCNLVIA